MARARRKPDAIDLLKQDHRHVERLFKEFEELRESGDHDAADATVETTCMELQIHDKLEIEIFYPAVRQKAAEEEIDLLDEAEVEHTTVRELIRKIEDLGPGADQRHAHFTVLSEYVKHHVKEEEKEMFPKVKKLDLDLRELADRLQDRKAGLMAEMGVESAEEASAEEERETTH